MSYQVPPPGYVPLRPRHKAKSESTFRQVLQGTVKCVDGYNKAVSLQALAGIARELRALIRG